jgi:hypothetical protein
MFLGGGPAAGKGLPSTQSKGLTLETKQKRNAVFGLQGKKEAEGMASVPDLARPQTAMAATTSNIEPKASFGPAPGTATSGMPPVSMFADQPVHTFMLGAQDITVPSRRAGKKLSRPGTGEGTNPAPLGSPGLPSGQEEVKKPPINPLRRPPERSEKPEGGDILDSLPFEGTGSKRGGKKGNEDMEDETGSKYEMTRSEAPRPRARTPVQRESSHGNSMQDHAEREPSIDKGSSKDLKEPIYVADTAQQPSPPEASFGITGGRAPGVPSASNAYSQLIQPQTSSYAQVPFETDLSSPSSQRKLRWGNEEGMRRMTGRCSRRWRWGTDESRTYWRSWTSWSRRTND